MPADPRPERRRLLMATVDTLPHHFDVLALVHASEVVASGDFAVTRLLDRLESEATKLGADGVIGIRMSEVAVPRTSRTRLVGQVTDHYDSDIVATALGTAVSWSLPAEPNP